MSLSNLWRKKQMASAYTQPRPMDPPPAPTDEKPRRNGIFMNERDRSIQVIIYHNDEESICKGLGSLEMAKDVIKQKITEWHMREQRRPAILVPQGNGKPH